MSCGGKCGGACGCGGNCPCKQKRNPPRATGGVAESLAPLALAGFVVLGALLVSAAFSTPKGDRRPA